MKTTRFWALVVSMLGMLFATACDKDKTEAEVLAAERQQCTLTVKVNNAEWGSVQGGGVYLEGDEAVVEAVPLEGYYFVRWDDGDTSNPRRLRVEADATLMALFSDVLDDPNPYVPDDGRPAVCGFDDEGASLSLFSVAAGRQVRFARGNLQYQASTGTWRFAEHQYDYIGHANRAISSTYGGWIDAFGWGCSGWNSGAQEYWPYSSSDNFAHYYPGGSYEVDLTGEYAEADWAWHNAIINGGNAAHQWRTLTSAEWTYLIEGRPGAADKHGGAVVGGVNGVVVLPDNWVLPEGLTFRSGFNGTGYDDYEPNSHFTLEEWARMEAAGAVFLPAGGNRYGTMPDNVGVAGCYWSVTQGSDRYSASLFYYDGDCHNTVDMNYRNIGCQVRPVKD